MIVASDGRSICALLDRNGLRPFRYLVTNDDKLVMASETGVLEVPPADVKFKGRLQPGRMFLVSLEQGRIIDDEELKAVSDVVRKHSSGSDLLLTQDLYLAVQAGRRVPRGLEMGPFSYFPDLSPDRARRLKVVGQEGLEELLRTTPARLAAVSGYGFAIQSPGVVEVSEEDRSSFLRLLNLRYRPLGHFPGFGQANTTVDLYQLDDLP